MADDTKTPSAAKAMTAADAAKAVKRPIVETKKAEDGTVTRTPKLVAVKADEVLSFKDYGTHVVVVTKDGQKFSSADLAETAAG